MRQVVLILFGILVLIIAMPALSQTKDQDKNQGKEPPKEQPKDVNIGGAWAMTVQTPNGDMPSDLTITQEKEALKVTLSSDQGTVSGEGTIKEGVVQWTLTVSTSQGDFTLVFKGKVDGEKMSGELQMGDFGTATWIAQKKKI